MTMNNTELFDNVDEMQKIAIYAREHELTIDYVIEEFVVNNQLIPVEVYE